MKRYLFGLSLSISALLFAFVPTAFAAPLCPPGQFSSLCTIRIDQGSGKNIVGNVITILLIIAIVLALIFLVLGGIRWILSGGDKGKIDQARSMITAAIVGLLLALLAFFIVNIISIVVTGHTFSSLTIPRLID